MGGGFQKTYTPDAKNADKYVKLGELIEFGTKWDDQSLTTDPMTRSHRISIQRTQKSQPAVCRLALFLVHFTTYVNILLSIPSD